MLVISGTAVSCAGIPTGAIPDLEEPQLVPPPKLPSVTLVTDEAGRKFYVFSEADALAVARHREEMAGEIIKGREGMRAYRKLLERCVGRR